MRTNVSGCAYRLMCVVIVVKIQDGQEEWQLQNVRSISDRPGLHLFTEGSSQFVNACVCLCYFLFDLLVHSHLTRSMQTTSPPHFSPIFSQSGWLNIWTAQMRELPWWRLMFAKYLPPFGPKATVIWEEPQTSIGASTGLNRITNYTLEHWIVTWDLNLTVTTTHLFSCSATIDFLICY